MARDLDVLMAMLVRADLGFVMDQSGPTIKVTLAEKAPVVFTFTKVGGALRDVALVDGFVTPC